LVEGIQGGGTSKNGGMKESFSKGTSGDGEKERHLKGPSFAKKRPRGHQEENARGTWRSLGKKRGRRKRKDSKRVRTTRAKRKERYLAKGAKGKGGKRYFYGKFFLQERKRAGFGENDRGGRLTCKKKNPGNPREKSGVGKED